MSPPEIDLSDAVVAITGAARGIGRATAEQFVVRGATVCLGDLDGDVAADTAKAIGSAAHPFQVDVADDASFAAFVSSVQATVGPIDVGSTTPG
jgi:NAD(P)-dependent dehydrogenase (short-subunit alcohol dehydrogenase family)